MASAAFFDNSWSSANAAARCFRVTVLGVAAFFAIIWLLVIAGFRKQGVSALV
jgi:hypothetical protein